MKVERNERKAVENHLGNRSGKCVLHGRRMKNWIGRALRYFTLLEEGFRQKEKEKEKGSMWISCLRLTIKLNLVIFSERSSLVLILIL